MVTVPLIRNGSAAGLTRPCHSGDVREGLPAFQRVPALIDCVTVAKIGASIRISVKGGVRGDHSGGAKGNHFQRGFEVLVMRLGAAGAEPCEAGGRAAA